MKKNNKIIKIVSPGRTCLFGDHQDYLGLPVIACAINKYISLNAFENLFSVFKIQLPDIGEERLIDIHDDFKILEKRDYFASSLKVLKRYGCIPDKGFNITITGDLPINAGLSSSSALIVAWIRFLLEAFGSTYETTPELVARMAYEAEVLEHKEPGGIMDQYTISIGSVLFINAREKASYEIIQNNLKGLIVGESGIKKETIGTLGNRKEFALKAIESVKLKNPDFDIQSALFEEYDHYEKDIPLELRPYFFAALKNHSITLKAFNEFKKEKPDQRYLGALMNEHHLVLKDILKITVPLIDQMVSKAIEAGAYGVKIVGSGGGGSIVAIAPLEKEQKVIEAICNAGAKAAYKVNVDRGARLID